MHNPNRILVTILLMMAPIVAPYAQADTAPALAINSSTPGAGNANASLGELSRLQDRLNEMELKSKAEKAPLTPSTRARTSAKAERTAPPMDLPVVTLVSGIGDKLQAILRFPNGTRVEVAAGDLAPGGYQVESVSVERVTLSRGKEHYPLAFSAANPSAAGNDVGTSIDSGNGQPFRQVPADLLPGVPFKMPALSSDQGANNGRR